jgi:hypothetical protein
VTNFDKISFFSLRFGNGKFRGFHPSSEIGICSVSDDLHVQNPTPGTHSRSGRSAQRHQTQRGTHYNKYNHWEDDDYNRYLSDLFWDDMLDTAPWMREA